MEAMALERLLLSSWEAEGFIGKTRVRVPSESYWREIDALALRAGTTGQLELRLGEVKARGAASAVWAVDGRARDADWWLGEWSSFAEGICALYPHSDGSSPLAGLPRWNDLSRVDVFFVFNGWEVPGSNGMDALRAGIRAMLSKSWGYAQENPRALANLNVQALSTRDLILDTFAAVKRQVAEGRGARYGDPVLDVARELFRFLSPGVVRGAEGTTGERWTPADCSAACAEETRARLRKLLEL